MREELVLEAIQSLPLRFNPRSDIATGRFHLEAGSVAQDVVVAKGGCRVEAPDGSPDVTISTDATTWLQIDAGRITGLEAFAQRRLEIRGSIEKSLQFETMFDRSNGAEPGYSLERVSLGGVHMSALMMGDPAGEPLVLIHGLGASKASWLPVVPQLARRYRVIVPDLPGFGASSKPRGRYDAAFFADHVFRLMDMLGLPSALVAGNSLGGRVSMEMAMAQPERVNGIVCLCPAAAFSKRPFLKLVRLARPELGIVASRMPRDQLRGAIRGLFASPDRLADNWYDAAIDDFLDVWKSPRARMAFFTAARNVYLDEPEGDEGFWMRLSMMKTPALYVYGARDQLISSRFAQRVQGCIPHAAVEVWDDCGHVPQLECTDRTLETMTKFFGSIEHAQAVQRQGASSAPGTRAPS